MLLLYSLIPLGSIQSLLKRIMERLFYKSTKDLFNHGLIKQDNAPNNEATRRKRKNRNDSNKKNRDREKKIFSPSRKEILAWSTS